MPNKKDANYRHAIYYAQVLRENNADFNFIDTAIAQIERAIEFALSVDDWDILSDMIIFLNSYWIKQGKWDDYMRFNILLLDMNLIDDRDQYVSIIYGIIEAESARGNYLEVLKFYDILFEFCIRQEYFEGIIANGKRASEICVNIGDIDRAMLYLDKVINFARQRKFIKDEVDILFELAMLYKLRGESDVAYSYLHNCLQITESINYFSKSFEVLYLLASLCVDRNKLQEARGFYHNALERAMKVGNKVMVNRVLEKLSVLEKLMGRSIFISYNHRDKEFVERLAKELRDMGLSIWWDQWEIQVGESIIQKVSDGIVRSGYLLVILSPNSVGSLWVQQEINSVLMRKISSEKDIIILPVLVAECEIPVLLSDIRWADFRYDYYTAFNRLLDVFMKNLR